MERISEENGRKTWSVPVFPTEFVRFLVERFPPIKMLLDEHVEDNGVILPHIFMGSLTPMLVSVIVGESTKSDIVEATPDILEFLDHAFEHGDENIKELLSVSFLENIPQTGQVASEVRRLLGPSLLEELRRRESWKPE